MRIRGSWMTASVVAVLAAGAPVAAQTLEQQIYICQGRADDDSPPARIAACSTLIRNAPPGAAALPVLYHNRGNAYFDQDDFARAIADQDVAIRSNHAIGYYALQTRAQVHFRQGNYARAIADYDEMIRREPGFSAGYSGRADVHERMGNSARAAADRAEAARRR